MVSRSRLFEQAELTVQIKVVREYPLFSDLSVHKAPHGHTRKFIVLHWEHRCAIEPDWWESIDMADALHPQTLLTWGINDGDLPVGFGGPLRLRVPRQLGYKSVKFITRLTFTDSLKGFGKGLGSAAPEAGYAWYAGI